MLGFGVLTAEAVLEGEKRKLRRLRQAVVLLEHSFPAGPSLLVTVAFVPVFSLVSEWKRGWGKQAGTRNNKVVAGMTVSREMTVS